MTKKGRKDFCIECRKETEYLLRKQNFVKTIRNKKYTFEIIFTNKNKNEWRPYLRTPSKNMLLKF